ncbi:MAG: AI-2E family transporter [Bacilli bacterium]|nr:AI-2E family transporter [Bacilli bacterium]
MRKGVNYKYLNILLILGIAYLLFLMKDVWLGIVSKAFNIALPFIIAFGVAYVLYPFLKFMINKRIPKALAVLIIIIVVLLIVGLTTYYVVPLFFNQLVNLLSSLGKVSTDIATKYGVDMKVVNDTISEYSSKMVSSLGQLVSGKSIISILDTSVNFLSKFIIIFIVSIYFLADMPNIRKKIKSFLISRNAKRYNLLATIDEDVYSYLKGLGIFMVIQFFEYTLLFLIIGHPNFLLIGVLACITTVIPYFGGIITNVFALIIASVISSKLFLLTLVVTIVFPNIDGYIISPKIYDKTNQLPPLLTIFVVSAGGALLGFTGIVIAVPATVIITAIVRAYKGDISRKITIMKKKAKQS